MEYKTVERLSPSSIIMLVSDYKKWYRNYILGEREPDNVYFQFGTAFHGLLEDFFNDKPNDSDTLKSYTERKFTELFEKWFQKNVELQTFFDEELGITMETSEEWVFDYLKRWLKETIPMEKKYGTEKAFSYNSPSICEWHLEDEELKVHGYVDAYYGKDKFNVASGFLNYHTILDYKTSKLDRNTNNTKYFLQTMIYALIYQRQNKRKSLNFVCVDYIKYGVKHYYHITENILSSIEKLINDAWLIVDKVNENPEKYMEVPPEKISLKSYI